MPDDSPKLYGSPRVAVGRVNLPPGVFLMVGEGEGNAMVGCVVDTLTRKQLQMILDTAVATVRAAMQRARG
jgi:hypothetical protein